MRWFLLSLTGLGVLTAAVLGMSTFADVKCRRFSQGDLVSLSSAAKAFHLAHGRLPSPQSWEAEMTMVEPRVMNGMLTDPWGLHYRMESQVVGDRVNFRFRCAGPDKVFGTGDDIVVDSSVALAHAE